MDDTGIATSVVETFMFATPFSIGPSATELPPRRKRRGGSRVNQPDFVMDKTGMADPLVATFIPVTPFLVCLKKPKQT